MTGTHELTNSIVQSHWSIHVLRCSQLVSSCVPVITWLCSHMMRFQSRPTNWPLLTIESPVAQWLQQPTRSWRVVGSNPIRDLDFFPSSPFILYHVGVQIKPVFQSKKISQVLSPKEKKPPIVNNQYVVYKFQCDLCDTDYVRYTTRHLHQRIGKHRYSAVGRHLEDHGLSKSDLKDKQFSVEKIEIEVWLLNIWDVVY